VFSTDYNKGFLYKYLFNSFCTPFIPIGVCFELRSGHDSEMVSCLLYNNHCPNRMFVVKCLKVGENDDFIATGHIMCHLTFIFQKIKVTEIHTIFILSIWNPVYPGPCIHNMPCECFREAHTPTADKR